MRTIICVMLTLAFAPGLAAADVLNVAPSQVVILPSDGSGVTRIAVQFDLSGMLAGEGRVIDQAVLDWTPSGLRTGGRWEFSAYAVTEAWSEESVTAGWAPAMAEDPAAEWNLAPADDAVDGGGLIRFNLKDLVATWEAGTVATNGLVLVMDDVEALRLVGQLSNMRLIVYYGFRR